MRRFQYLTELDLRRVNSNTKRLLNDFIVKDLITGLKWKAPKDMKTDGASIPPELQPIIGDPFAGVTAPAATIHDHYCVTKNRSQAETHKVFYELVKHEMKTTYEWYPNLSKKNFFLKLIPNPLQLYRSKVWQYTRAWLMYKAVVKHNRIKNPNWK